MTNVPCRPRDRRSLRGDVGEYRCTERLVRLLAATALVDELPVRERVGEPASGDASRADVVEHVRVAAANGRVIDLGHERVVLVANALDPIVRALEGHVERHRERRLGLEHYGKARRLLRLMEYRLRRGA